MKCPKCQWPSSPEHQSTLQYHHTEDGRYYQCNDCGLVWTEWQQEQIAALKAERDALKEKNVKLRNGIKKTMWASRWREEALVTCCVGCGRSEWDVSDNGHDTDCWLDALLKVE